MNAVTYFFSIEPRRRGELLGLFSEFKRHIPDFSRRDREAIRGYLFLAHYSAAHFTLTVFSLVFSVISISLMLYGAAVPAAMVDAKWMISGVLLMLILVPFGSIWLTIVCRNRFQRYLSAIADVDS